MKSTKLFSLSADAQMYACCVLSVLALLTSSSAAGWWNNTWSYRREISVENYEPTSLPGDDISVVTFATGGLCADDGGDIRVATAKGMLVPSRVIMLGPGDLATVAFALRPGAGGYHVYYGNPKANADENPQLEMKRGLMLEMWKFTDGEISTLRDVRNRLADAKELIGRGFRDRIWQRHNPFAQTDKFAAEYTGWLEVRSGGEYTFACSTRNASFVLIDDKLLISNGGRHDYQRTASKQGKVNLSPGLHKVTFYHVTTDGEPLAVLAWRPPWESNPRKFNFVPPAAFSQVFDAKTGRAERYGGRICVDIDPTHAGESFLYDRYLHRYTFRATWAGTSRRMNWTWNFGDGIEATGESVEHVYLLPGEYTVELTGEFEGGRYSAKQRVHVDRDWDRVLDETVDAIGIHANIVRNYDFARLSAEHCAQAVVLLDRVGDVEKAQAAGEAMLGAKKTGSVGALEAMRILVDLWLDAGRPRDAFNALIKASALVDSTGARHDLRIEAANIALYRLGDVEQADELFEQVSKALEKNPSSGRFRRARIGQGDVLRHRSQTQGAREMYESLKNTEAPGGEDFQRGSFARHVEEYIRTGDYDVAEEYLDKWAYALPADKLDGFWSLFRVRLMQACSRYGEAIMEARVLLGVNPSSPYAPELLFMSAQCHLSLDQPGLARKALQRIVDEYGESTVVARAKEMLGI